jgi:K(+)-stimulated pyrophosphate-energized sodium pump
VVEVDLKQKGTLLHDATVIGDTVGDPFKDTSSVAMNPVIKFTTLFGLLAVELAVAIRSPRGQFGDNGMMISHVMALAFFLVSTFFVWRSFYRMRIGSVKVAATEVRVDSIEAD